MGKKKINGHLKQKNRVLKFPYVAPVNNRYNAPEVLFTSQELEELKITKKEMEFYAKFPVLPVEFIPPLVFGFNPERFSLDKMSNTFKKKYQNFCTLLHYTTPKDMDFVKNECTGVIAVKQLSFIRWAEYKDISLPQGYAELVKKYSNPQNKHNNLESQNIQQKLKTDENHIYDLYKIEIKRMQKNNKSVNISQISRNIAAMPDVYVKTSTIRSMIYSWKKKSNN